MLRSSWICSETDELIDEVKRFYLLTSGLNMPVKNQDDFSFESNVNEWNQLWLYEYSQSSFFPQFSPDSLKNSLAHAEICDHCAQKIQRMNRRLKKIRQRKNLVHGNIIQQVIVNNLPSFIQTAPAGNVKSSPVLTKQESFNQEKNILSASKNNAHFTLENNKKSHIFGILSLREMLFFPGWRKVFSSFNLTYFLPESIRLFFTAKRWETLRFSIAGVIIALGIFSNPYYLWQKFGVSVAESGKQFLKHVVFLTPMPEPIQLDNRNTNIIKADIGLPEIFSVVKHLQNFLDKKNIGDSNNIEISSITKQIHSPQITMDSDIPDDKSMQTWLDQWPAPMEKMIYERYLYLKQMSALFPNDTAIMTDLAVFAHFLGKKKEKYEIISSVMAYEASIDIENSDDSIDTDYVYIDQEQTQNYLWKYLDEKIASLERTLRINPYHQDAIKDLAMIYNALGYKTLAYHYIRKWRALS